VIVPPSGVGELAVVDLDYRMVTEWQAKLARELAPRTVRHHRQTLAQVVDEAVKMGALVGNPVRSVKPLRVTDSEGVALDRDETWAVLGATRDLVFTTPTGGLVLRQAVAKLVKQAAKTAGISADLGTHTGRRTVVTTLFVDGDESLVDIARFVGHARPATTRRLRQASRPSAPGGRPTGRRHRRR
jgi:integrase